MGRRFESCWTRIILIISISYKPLNLRRFFLRETCPHTRHPASAGKTIGERHLREQRALLDRHILKDAPADKSLAEITRGDFLEFQGIAGYYMGPAAPVNLC